MAVPELAAVRTATASLRNSRSTIWVCAAAVIVVDVSLLLYSVITGSPHHAAAPPRA